MWKRRKIMFANSKKSFRETLCESLHRVSVDITVDASITAVSNKTNDIQCSNDT